MFRYYVWGMLPFPVVLTLLKSFYYGQLLQLPNPYTVANRLTAAAMNHFLSS